MPSPKACLSRLDGQLEAFERLVDDEPLALDLRAPEVSAWSVRQQVDHSLKVLHFGLLTLEKGTDRTLVPINLLGRFLMALGWIPRGRGKSPERVLPEERTNAELAGEVRRLRAGFSDPALSESARFSDPKPIFPHPYFGGLDAAQGVHFLGMHTHHHWKIVRDIRKRARN
jgi:hypothetical protein